MHRAAIAFLLLFAACLAPKHAHAPPPVVACDHGRCPAPYTCRYKRVESRVQGECRLETGRCNSDFDCAPTSQMCQRFGPDPGVCVQRGN